MIFKLIQPENLYAEKLEIHTTSMKPPLLISSLQVFSSILRYLKSHLSHSGKNLTAKLSLSVLIATSHVIKEESKTQLQVPSCVTDETTT